MPDEFAPGYRRDPLRIACVQFDPHLRDVRGNTAKVLRMTEAIRPGSLDLLVLPEMCLSGYMFTTPSSIVPYLESSPRIGTSSSSPHHPSSSTSASSVSSSSGISPSPSHLAEPGPTTKLAQQLAARLSCVVIAGYPERGSWPSFPSHDPSQSSLPAKLWDVSLGREVEFTPVADRVGWNSAVVVGKDGQVVGNYRKTSLYYTDMYWAREGDGFKYFDFPAPLGRLCLGICMDMNPKDFVAPYDAYELANFVRDVGGDILVVPMAWLNPPGEDATTRTSSDGEAEVGETASPSLGSEAAEESTLNYWASRLTPLHDPSPGYGKEESAEEKSAAKEVVFVTCNRVGEEEGTTFVGTSCVMTIESAPRSRIELLEVLGRAEEGVLFAAVN